MDPAAEQTIEAAPDAPDDGMYGVDAGMLAAVGGGSGLLLVLAIAVVVGLRLRGRSPSFEEPEEVVVPADHVAPPPDLAPPTPPESTGLVGRLRSALSRSRDALQGSFDALFGRETIDESLFEDLETTLIKADVGIATSTAILDELRALVKAGTTEPAELRTALREAIRSRLARLDPTLSPPPGAKPWIVLVVGVNGSGKTTTIGKLAARYQQAGQRVMLAAGDTYRAAAADQLAVWAERAGVDIVRGDPGSDPGAVVYQAIEAAQARGHDVVLVDTAGRLQTARPLMEQLTKVRRVIAKRDETGPHETLLVLDGTMGQNGLSQARLFNEATPLTGAVVTKLDGTAKGGMVLTLSNELDLPIKLIGIGERMGDLKDFDADAFAEALA